MLIASCWTKIERKITRWIAPLYKTEIYQIHEHLLFTKLELHIRKLLTNSSTTSFGLSFGVTTTTTESIRFVGSGSGRMTVMVVGVVLVSKSIGNKGSALHNKYWDIISIF